MNPVKKILQNIVSGKFNDEKEAKNMYSNNVYVNQQRIRMSDNKTDHKKDMIEVYDQARRIFIVPSEPDMNYVPNRGKSDGEADEDKSANKQLDTTDMPDSENEESAEQGRKQKGQELRALTPHQMLSRPPISLAQLKAGNNSQKIKNEIRQLLY